MPLFSSPPPNKVNSKTITLSNACSSPRLQGREKLDHQRERGNFCTEEGERDAESSNPLDRQDLSFPWNLLVSLGVQAMPIRGSGSRCHCPRAVSGQRPFSLDFFPCGGGVFKGQQKKLVIGFWRFAKQLTLLPESIKGGGAKCPRNKNHCICLPEI